MLTKETKLKTKLQQTQPCTYCSVSKQKKISTNSRISKLLYPGHTSGLQLQRHKATTTSYNCLSNTISQRFSQRGELPPPDSHPHRRNCRGLVAAGLDWTAAIGQVQYFWLAVWMQISISEYEESYTHRVQWRALPVLTKQWSDNITLPLLYQITNKKQTDQKSDHLNIHQSVKK